MEDAVGSVVGPNLGRGLLDEQRRIAQQRRRALEVEPHQGVGIGFRRACGGGGDGGLGHFRLADRQRRQRLGDRKSVVEGKSVSVRVDTGGRRIFKTKLLLIYSYQ